MRFLLWFLYFSFSFFLILVIILIAIGGGLLLGAATLVFVWRMRVKYKRELEKQRNQKYPRVSFTIPPPRKGESPIPLQTNYPQREQKGLENYLDPEIYRWWDFTAFAFGKRGRRRISSDHARLSFAFTANCTPNRKLLSFSRAMKIFL